MKPLDAKLKMYRALNATLDDLIKEDIAGLTEVCVATYTTFKTAISTLEQIKSETPDESVKALGF